jgi:hypothetical protein
MVYNGTSSLMNAHLWVLWFALTTIYDATRALELGTYMDDSDVGAMFLNFMLEERYARLTGSDLAHCVPKGEVAGEGRRHVACWNICLMGFFSLYQMGHAT